MLPSKEKKLIKLAVMGFGNAAKAFTKILIEKEAVLLNQGLQFEFSTVSTGTRGSLVAAKGEVLDKKRILDILEKTGHFRNEATYSEMTTMEIIKSADYDVMIELTPLEIMSGEPAISHIETALTRKKHVITANKGPIAWAYKRLKALSEYENVQFLYETTVMDGTPIFNLKQFCLPYCEVKGVRGILNTTTNFVLEHLAKGEALEAVMEEGRRRGFVEADPSLDIEGWDSAAKLTALMNVLMDADIKPTDVVRSGIENITLDTIQEAGERGKVIKLLCEGIMTSEGPKAKVSPVELSKSDLYATVDETSSIISIETDLMGEISVVEHHPEIEQTGFGIFSDLITLCKNIV